MRWHHGKTPNDGGGVEEKQAVVAAEKNIGGGGGSVIRIVENKQRPGEINHFLF
jgi:hypothetical protein